MLPELKTGQAIVKVRGEPIQLLRVYQPPIRPEPALVATGLKRCLQLGKWRQQIEEEIAHRTSDLLSSRSTKSESLPEEANSDDAQGALPEGYE